MNHTEHIATMHRWQGHGHLWAERVVNIKFNPRSDQRITWELANGDMIAVSNELLCRGTSTPIGGYYVLYPDGQEDWMNARTFEAAFSKVKEDKHAC